MLVYEVGECEWLEARVGPRHQRDRTKDQNENAYDPKQIEKLRRYEAQNLEFEIGDKVFLKVAPLKGILRFGCKSKLN